MAATFRDVARLAHVSPTTVSFALNGTGRVGEETRRRVLEAAQSLGIAPRSAAPAPGGALLQMVVYKKDSLTADRPFVESVIQGANEYAGALGFRFAISYFYKNQDPEEQLRSIASIQCAGAALLATDMPLETIRLFDALKVPVVLIENSLMQRQYHAVTIDNRRGAYWAAEHLIQCGHTHIGYLHGKTPSLNFRERKEGFLAALRQWKGAGNGKPFKPYILPMQPTVEGAYEDMVALLAGDPVLPTAFFADSDHIAMGCIEALHRYGYRVPDDISVIGFGGMPLSNTAVPPLTTMTVSGNMMARLAVRCLGDCIQGNSGPALARIAVLPELTESATVRSL